MGYKSTQAVLEGLFGREFTVERINAKTGKRSIKRLAAQEMALLLTVAARQSDPYVFPNDSDPIWFANEEKLCNFVHFKKSALYDSRNFLVQLGLLRYSKSKRHMDYANPSRSRCYTNVYQINREKLEAMAMDLKVRNAEEFLCNTETKVRNTETHTDSRDKNQQTGNSDLSDVNNKEYLKRVVNAIAASLEINASDILPNVIAEAIRGKFPDSVFDAIQDPKSWFRTAKVPLNALVSILRRLPLQKNDPNYRRQTQPTTKELLENIPKDIFYLVNDAIKNTGCKDPTFVQQLIPLLQQLLCTPEGQAFAVETIDQHKATDNKESKIVSKRLLHTLARGEIVG